MTYRFLPIFLTLVFAAAQVWAQEDDPASPSSEPSADQAAPENLTLDEQTLDESPTDDKPADDKPAETASFDELFEQWKEILAELRQLQIDYQSASDEQRTALATRFQELAEKGEEMVPRITAAAEAAYRQAPNENPDVVEFLAAAIAVNYQRDDHDRALEVAELLIENDYENPAVYNWAGLAAFANDQFELAKGYLQQAKEKGGLDKLGAQYLADIDTQIELWQQEQALREAEAEADNLPRVLLKTNHGDLVLELYEDQAPNTVANFVDLVEKNFYDGVIFHRVLHTFMAQTGDPKGNGTGGPGYHIRCETDAEDHRNHFSGTLSMAHAGQDTGGSQFFITFVPTPHLNGKHTVFGRVIEGQEVLPKLQRRDPSEVHTTPPDRIIEATIIRKRDHEYQPETLPESPTGR